MNENKKQNDYYEIHPEKISIISILIYLTYFIFIFNKKKEGEKNIEDEELSSILRNIITYMIKIWKSTALLLEARHCRTKSNRYLNNIQNSFQANDLGNFQDNMQSSKDLSFIEINKKQEQNEFTQRRRTVKETKFSRRMELFKSEFSFNKKIGNKKSNNDLKNYSSANGDSSLSNFDKNKEIDINYLRANSTKIDENFLDNNRLSGNFKIFMNPNKKGILKNINNSKNKNKFIKYIRYELKDLENNKRNSIKHQSCKSFYNEQLNDKITGEENLFFLSKKESSIFDDDLFLFSEKSLDCSSILFTLFLSISYVILVLGVFKRKF